MARSFPGGGATDNLATTITAYNSGPYSVFAWTKNAGGGGGSNPRIFHIGTGTSGQIFYSSGGGSRSLEQQYATSQMLANYTTSFGAGWEFTVITYDGSTLNPADLTDIDLFNGDVSTSMVDTMGLSVATVGSGARTTGLVDLVIGNRQNGLNRCWSGELFAVGMVPYRMTLSDAETLRTGNLTPLFNGTAPIFFFSLEGSTLTSYPGLGPSLTLTATGTSSTSDPITLSQGNPTPSVIAVTTTVPTPSILGDLSITPGVVSVSATVYTPSISVPSPSDLEVVEVGGTTGTSSASVTSPSWTSTAGSTIAVMINCYDVNTTLLGSHVSDSKGNTYVLGPSSNGGSGQVGVGIWYNEGGTRGASHTVTFNPGTGTFPCIAVAEVTGPGAVIFDDTTDATSTDGVSPFDVTSAAAIGGEQIAFYVAATDTGQDNAYGAPAGYDEVYVESEGSLGGLIGAYYKIGETGTPTVGATKGGSVAASRNAFATFKSVPIRPYIVPGSYDDWFDSGAGIPKPSGGQVGDCYVITTYNEPATFPATITVSGFTLLGYAGDDFTHDIQLNVFYRWYDGSEGSTFSLSGTDAGTIFIVRGADPDITPVAGTFTFADLGTGSPSTAKGIKTFSDNNLLLICHAHWDAHGTLASTGFAYEGGHFINNLNEVLSGTQRFAGDTGDKSVTFTGTESHVDVLVSFAPGKPAALVVPTIIDRQTSIASSTVTKPLYGQTGDFYVASIEVENAVTPSSVGISGFTSIGYVSVLDSPSGITQTFVVVWKEHDGQEPSSFTITGGGTDYNEVFIIRGAAPGTPLSNNAQAAASGGTLGVTGVTTTVDNTLVLVATHGVQSDNAALTGFSTVSTWDSGTGELFSKTQATAGATGTATLTWTSGTVSIAAGIIAFPPLEMEEEEEPPAEDIWLGVIFRRRFQMVETRL